MEKQVPFLSPPHLTNSVALKIHRHVPESLEKEIPLPSSLHSHLKWWLQDADILPGQPLHPFSFGTNPACQIKGWGH